MSVKKTNLILGGAGFIGFNLAKFLVEKRGEQVIIADNFFRCGGKMDPILQAFIHDHQVSIIEGDFTKPEMFEKLEGFYDHLYMLASVVGVDYVNQMPDQIIRINTALIFNALEWLRKAKIKKALFTSTSEAYAGAIEAFGYTVPTDEKVPLTISEIGHPRFTYAVTKMLGESGFINYSRQLDFECSIVRYHNVYGPRMGFKHVIPHLAQRFLNKEEPFKIYGHDQTRSFNFIDDAVLGTVLAMEKGQNHGIYHIGSEDEISIEDLTRYVGRLMGFSGTYEYAPTYPGSVSRRCPDITKAREELGYSPRVGWEEGVRTTIDWYVGYIRNSTELYESFYQNKERTKK